MTRGETIVISTVATAVLAVAIVIAWLATGESTGGTNDPTVALAFITFTAVGIERIVEMGWTFIGGVWGSFWPLRKVKAKVGLLVADLNLVLTPLKAEVDQALAAAANLPGYPVAVLQSTATRLTNLDNQLNELMSSNTGSNSNARKIAETANEYVSTANKLLNNVTPTIQTSLNATEAAIESLENFSKSFTDNPGRRIISIYFGVLLGVAVAAIFELNLFHAVLEDGADGVRYVILTGVIIGLGSTPTHEVIRAVQEYKKTRKSSA